MARISNGRSLAPQTNTRPANRKGPRNHALSALAVAEKQNPTRTKIRKHRLGEIEEEDGSHRKSENAAGKEDEERTPKRRKRETASDEDDVGVATSDSDGDKWHVGVKSDDEDSDLDSDNAMGESDEERFEGFAFRGSAAQKTRKPKRTATIAQPSVPTELDLLEGEAEDAESEAGSEGEEEDDLGKDAVDLATALDLNEEEQQHRQKRTPASIGNGPLDVGDLDEPGISSSSSSGSSEGDDEDGKENSDYEDDELSNLSISDDDDEPANTNRLRSFVESLQDQSTTTRPSGRVRFNVPNKPSDFGIRSSRKLTIADLLPTVTDPGLRKSLKVLHNSEKAGLQPYSGGIPGKLAPPLAKRQQDRLDRAAAYDKSKETLSRWIDTVKQNRRAEHISFPLPDPDIMSAPGTKELMPTTQSQPLTSLESTIQNIMQESGLAAANGQSADDQFQAFEELQERTMPVEEVQARRAELRKARELLFQEEVRARRIKKIKSKSYRRVHRREREKIAQEEHAALAAAGALNSDEERERNDRQRAEARMGARHRESKWARGVKAAGRASWDDDARAGVTDLARRDEELRRRIEGKRVTDSGASESEISSDSENDGSLNGSEGGSRRRLEQKLNGLDAPENFISSKSKLSSMAFMQRAEASRKAINDAEIEQMRRDLVNEGIHIAEPPVPESAGRLRFGSQGQPKNDSKPISTVLNDFEERLSEDEEANERQARAQSEEVESKINDHRIFPQGPGKVKQVPRTSKMAISDQGTNPWLNDSRESGDDLLKGVRTVQSLPDSKQLGRKTKVNVSRSMHPKSLDMADEATSSSGSDEEDAQPHAGELALSRNEELVRMTFAGDDVFEDFDKEKRETVEDEGDQVIDNTLPGWGSWTGSGISKREQKRNKGRLITTIKGVQEDKRKDARLERVIVNEKRVKKVRLF